MEKVKLTKEQAEAIEMLVTLKKGDIDKAFKSFLMPGDFLDGLKALQSIDAIQAAKIFYAGYEIEPEQPKFQPGDKVIRKDGITFAGRESVWTVTENGEFEEQVEIVGSVRDWPIMWEAETIRHATPEEIYWLETLGRNFIGDFRVGDCYVDEDGYATTLDKNDHIELAQGWYKENDFLGIYPVESYKPLYREETK